MKTLIPILASTTILFIAEAAQPQTLLHQDSSPFSCTAMVSGMQSTCSGFRMVESENAFVFIFDGFLDRGNVGFVALREPFRTEQGASGVVTNVYAVGHFIEGEAASEIVGYCVWSAPLDPPLFNGSAICRDSIEEGAAEYEYRGAQN